MMLTTMKITLATFLTLLLMTTVIPLSAAESNSETLAIRLIDELGCKGCHRIGSAGGSTAADLSEIGTRMSPSEIAAFLKKPQLPQSRFMPEYSSLSDQQRDSISRYLYQYQH